MRRISLFVLTISLFLYSGCRINSQTPSQQTTESLSDYFRYGPDKPVLISAHRGGKGLKNYPENCLETIQFVYSRIPDAIFEIDIAKTSDDVLVLMHDDALERTTNGFGPIKEKSYNSLQKLWLEDDEGRPTPYQIPRLKSVLEWADQHQVILMLDIKRSVGFEEVLTYVEAEEAIDNVVIITYSVEAARKLYNLNPQLMLSVSIRNQEELDRMDQSGIPTDRWVAFTGTRASEPALYQQIHERGVMCILGSLGNLDRQAEARGPQIYQEFVNQGIDIFATDRPLACFEAVRP